MLYKKYFFITQNVLYCIPPKNKPRNRTLKQKKRSFSLEEKLLISYSMKVNKKIKSR